MKTTLETSVEDVKTTLETSGEDGPIYSKRGGRWETTLETSGEEKIK